MNGHDQGSNDYIL